MNINALMDIVKRQALADARRVTFTLGQLIDALEALPADKPIRFAFGYVRPTKLRSYRGHYDHLALGYGEEEGNPTVGSLLEECRSAVGREFTGYKGGEFTMDRETPVWVANYGNTGETVIVGVRMCKSEYEALIYSTVSDE